MSLPKDLSGSIAKNALDQNYYMELMKQKRILTVYRFQVASRKLV